MSRIGIAENLDDLYVTDEECAKANDKATELMDHVGKESEYNLSTLYFLWADATDILLDAGGWSVDELHKEINKLKSEMVVREDNVTSINNPEQ